MNRERIVLGIISAGFICILLGLAFNQIVRGEYYFRLSQENRIRLSPIEAVRGSIFDRMGRVLAKDELAFDLAVIPQELSDKDATFKMIGKALSVPVVNLNSKYRKGYLAPFAEVALVKDLNRDEAFKLEQMSLDVPCVVVRPKPRRHYAYGKSSSHVLGYLGMINRRELSRLKPYGYTGQDLIGQSGLEKTLDTYLRGEDGGMQIEVDHRGRQIRVLGKKVSSKGKDVMLTIDAQLQAFIYSLLGDRGAAVVVADANSGEVLALVSSPGYDPAIFITSSKQHLLSKLLNSKKYPLLNRAVQCSYSPGSTFKVVTAACALELRKIAPHSVFDCMGAHRIGNRDFACWIKGGHGPQDLKHAIMHSCNVYFFKLGQKIGEKELARFAYLFNFGKKTGIDLPGETMGLVPERRWKRSRLSESWYEGDTANFAIGQGYVLASPLQVLQMICAIANGGKFVHPYVIKSIDTVEVGGTRTRSLGLSDTTLSAIKKGLSMAVNDKGGTAIRARVSGLEVSGKTGTSQVAGSGPHAWFTGYASSGKSTVGIVVFFENGGYGGEVAAPVAGKIFRKMKEMDMI